MAPGKVDPKDISFVMLDGLKQRALFDLCRSGRTFDFEMRSKDYSTIPFKASVNVSTVSSCGEWVSLALS